jgi:hypothetical protein
MLEKLRNLFAARRPAASPAAARPTLWRSETFDELARMILAMPETDCILLKGALRRSSLKKLLYDDEIYQAVSTRLDGLLIVPVRLEPTEGRKSRFIQERCLTPQILRAILTGAFNARLFGFSVMETIWDEDVYKAEGAFVPRDVSERNIDYFTVRPDGTLVQMLRGGLAAAAVSRSPELQKRIADVPGAEYSALVMDTDYKFLLTRHAPTWENPYGEALLSRLWWPWFFRQKTWSFYGQYLERYAIPMLVGHAVDVDKMAETLALAHQDAVIAVDVNDRVESVNVNSYGHSLYDEAESMLLRRIEKLVLGQTLTSGTDGGSGNRALGQVHNAVREDKVKSDIALVHGTVQHFVDACFRLNGFAGDPPEVVFGDDVQLASDRAARDAVLMQHGIVGGFSEGYLMDNYGLRPGEFTMPQPGGPGAGDGGGGQGRRGEVKAAAGGGGHAFNRHAHDLELEALALWAARRDSQPMDEQEILSAILESDSAMELMDRLKDLRTRAELGRAILEADEAAFVLGGTGSRK